MRGGQKKHNRKYFGYNNHVNTDVKSKVILKATVTAAHVHDSQEVKPPGIPHYKIFLAVAFFCAKFHRGTSKNSRFLKGSHQFFLGGRGEKNDLMRLPWDVLAGKLQMLYIRAILAT